MNLPETPIGPTDTGQETRPCSVCREIIKPDARKCIHCDSYQGWRGRIGLSTEVLSLLVALVAVSGPMIPVVTDAFVADNSDISISFQQAASNEVSVFVSNSGTRPGTLLSSGALILTAKDGTDHRYRLEVIGARASLLVSPGTSQLRTFFAFSYGVPEPASRVECWLIFQTTEFRGNDRIAEIPIECEKTFALVPKPPASTPAKP